MAGPGRINVADGAIVTHIRCHENLKDLYQKNDFTLSGKHLKCKNFVGIINFFRND
jgi:hypothetical protein